MNVTNVSNALGAFTYAYVDTTSRLSEVTYPSGTGLSTSYGYFPSTDPQDFERLETIQNMNGSTQLSKFSYTYNPVGTIATWTQQADSSTAVVNTLSYDGADQLINAVQSGGGSAGNAYHYDPAGNRLAEVTASSTTAGQFNNLNQLTGLSSSTTSTTVAGNTSAAVSSVTVNAVPATITSSTNFTANVPLPNGTNVVSVVAQPSGGTNSVTTKRYQIVNSGTAPTTLTYDANGNTLTDENGYSYTWDALNRLAKITYPSGASSLFAYDGLSRRISIIEKSSSGTVTSTKNYLWIGQEIAEERDGSNAVTKRFFPQGEQQSGTNYYYTFDHQKSVRELCDSSGNIKTQYSYDPYGRTTTNHLSGSLDATKQYDGYYIHPASGLALTRYRAYDVNTGRWLGRDPLAEDVGPNLYEYADDDPTDETDPLGLAPSPEGHHIVPRALWKDAPDTIKKVFDDIKNRLADPNYNQHNGKAYNGVNENTYRKAVTEKLEDFLKRLGKKCISDLTPEEAQQFASEVRATSSGPIAEYNAGVAAEMAAATGEAAAGGTAAAAGETTAAEGGGMTVWDAIMDIIIFGPK